MGWSSSSGGRRPVRFSVVVVAWAAVLVASGVVRPAAPVERFETEPIEYAAEDAADHSVERLYLAYFLRDPDAAGLAYWESLQAAGMPLSAISAAFAGSHEFVSTYGALSDGGFVTLVYRNVLSRTPDDGGYAYWTGRLAAGLSRGGLMIGFSESDEFRATYQRRLEQSGSTAGQVVLGSDGLPTAAEGHYAFSRLRADGTPFTWAPCEPVGVVANFTGAPAGAEAALTEALAQLSSATRITWRYEGTTDERASSALYLDRPYTDPARYGDRYSPVLVSWPPDWSDGGSSIGYGGFAAAWQVGETPYAVTGAVTLKPGWQPGSRAQLVSLFLHELAHVANLAHVPHADEVMYPTSRGYAAYQAGDLAGLARVGAWTSSC